MEDFLRTYSYLGLFVILFIEEAGIPLPIPGDLFIATTASLKSSNYLLVVITDMTATLAGSTILFTLSKKIGHRILIKYGKYVKITPDKIKKVEKWFTKYGSWAIVIGRLTPGLRTITPIAAGLFDLPYKTFWTYTLVAAFIWANVYFVIGKFFGEVLSNIPY